MPEWQSGNGQTIFSPGRPEDVTEGGAKVEVQEEVQEEAGSEGEVEVEKRRAFATQTSAWKMSESAGKTAKALGKGDKNGFSNHLRGADTTTFG